jgi:hypothetical protein
MFKFVTGFVLAAFILANADDKPVQIFLKDTVLTNCDSILWIVAPEKIDKSYKNGELLIGVGVTTLHDNSYRIFDEPNGGTNIIINLYDIMRRYYADQSKITNGQFNGKAGSADAAFLKRNGFNWRIVAKPQK